MEISLTKYDSKIVFHESIPDLFQNLKTSLGRHTNCCIIADEFLLHNYKQTFENFLFPIIPIPSGETSKTLQMAESCWQEMSRKGMDRQSAVIAVGGGVVTDLAGFVGACYMRGIATYYIPTTLLSMVDAAIGGKTGVNLPQGKNLVGAIYQPKEVHICQDFLLSLPDREFKSGLAEVIKYGVIWDADFFELLEQQMDSILKKEKDILRKIIERSCEIKSYVVLQDEKEQNLRAILNWGHTFGHAIEAITGYKQFLHGEAISIGMSCAAYVSYYLKRVDLSFIDRQDNLLKKAGLPIDLPSSIDIDTLIERMTSDKKAISGKITLIVADRIGKVTKLTDIDKTLIKEALGCYKQKRSF